MGVSMTGWGSVQYADLDHAPWLLAPAGRHDRPQPDPDGHGREGRERSGPRGGSGGHPCISFVASDPWTGVRDSLDPGLHHAETAPLSLAWKLQGVCATMRK